MKKFGLTFPDFCITVLLYSYNRREHHDATICISPAGRSYGPDGSPDPFRPRSGRRADPKPPGGPGPPDGGTGDGPSGSVRQYAEIGLSCPEGGDRGPPGHRERCGISLRPPESDGPGRGLPHRRAGGRQDHRPGLRLPHGPFLAGREVVSHHRAGGAQGSAGHAGHRSQWPGHGIHCPGLRTGPQRRQPGEAPAAVPAGM